MSKFPLSIESIKKSKKTIRPLGQEKVLCSLEASFDENRFAQTHLFSGPSGIGKKKTAFYLAQRAFCENAQARPCGNCLACLQFNEGNHGSFLFIEPEGGILKIESARRILEFLSLKSWTRYRFVVMDGVQTLGPQGANALLKILEEPPKETYFILITSMLGKVLPTIRSRSRLVSFKPLDRMSLQNLTGENVDSWILNSSLGSMERWEQLGSSEEISLRKKSLNFLLAFLGDGDFFIYEGWREHLRDKVKAQSLLANWIFFLRDLLVYKINPAAFLLNPETEGLLEKLKVLDVLEIQSLLKGLLLIESGVPQNWDIVLSIEKLYVEIRLDKL